ncbi:OmpP1/FadL family transporter [Granulicella sibirica]|nr:outer membrane protein transport protein [Granulicella sibirica]
MCGAFATTATHAQGSASLGNGLSAAAMARGGSTVTEHASPLDAVEGNPAGLAGLSARGLDVSVLGLVAGGTFNNSVNHNAKLRGVAGVMPFGAFATPIGHTPWVAAVAFTPEVLMRANWHYNDAPGTAGVTYGYQKQETQIIAVRSSLGIARSFGPKWSVGATAGIVYNQNDLHAPYIFQQEPHLAGLKVLLNLTTRGYGWNGGAGVQFAPNSRLRTGLSWKSGTTIRTQGNADGSASALFTALGLTNDPSFHYHTQVQNDLPQAFSAGASYKVNQHVTLAFQGDFTGWHTAFAQLPITLTQGNNAVINSVVGADHFNDAVPLHWRNQGTFHAGAELPVTETVTVRAGYQYADNPVPASTLLPLTAAIMQQAIGTGAGWTHKRWHYDAAYQVQLPATQSVGQSAILAGEYDNSRLKIWTQSLTLTARMKF